MKHALRSLLVITLAAASLRAADAPKPPPKDPDGGIPVAGGKVHRGIGTHVNPENPKDKRAAFDLWITPDPGSPCKKFRWYQYVRAEARISNASSSADVTKDLAREGAITTAIGSDLTFGKWSGDYPKTDEKKQHPKPRHEKMRGTNVDAGPYADRPIPGVSGAEGLVDAPNWGNTGAWKELISRLTKPRGHRLPGHGTGNNPPPDEEFTLVVTEHFRDYLYCVDPPPSQCIGYSEETYSETMRFKLSWKPSSQIALGGASNQEWDAVVSLESDNSSVAFGEWRTCY